MDDGTELVTQAEYARRRGWSKQYVHQLVREGRIKLVGRLIDPEKADVSLNAERDPNLAVKAFAEAPDTGSGFGGVGGTPGPASTFFKARTVREHYRALREKAEYEASLGRLMDVDDVRTAGFEFGKWMKDALVGVAPDITENLCRSLTLNRNDVGPIVRAAINVALIHLSDRCKEHSSLPFADSLDRRG
jgi:hypothetical protein